MLDRTSFHARFAEMLGGDDEALTPWLADASHAARLRVYRNNVVTAWADAIVKNYPAVERLVGTEFMRGAAVAFTKVSQPQSPVLTMYGDGFATFIESFPPAKDVAYLGDVARLDRAWTESFFAVNERPLKPEGLAGLTENQIAALALRLHPSVRIVTSRWNAWEIWRANRTADEASKVALTRGETAALVWWSPDGMADRQLSAPELAFLSAIEKGAPLGEALNVTGGDDGQAALLAFFSEALARGIFSGTTE